MRIDTQFFTIHILTDSHIFHFRSYNTRFGIRHLCNRFSRFSPIRQCNMLKTQMIQTLVISAHLTIFGSNRRQLLHISTTCNPAFTHMRQAFLQINLHVRVTERTTCIIYINRSIGGSYLFTVYRSHGRSKVHFLHAYLYKRKHCTLYICLFPMCVRLIFFVIFHNCFYLVKE